MCVDLRLVCMISYVHTNPCLVLCLSVYVYTCTHACAPCTHRLCAPFFDLFKIEGGCCLNSRFTMLGPWLEAESDVSGVNPSRKRSPPETKGLLQTITTLNTCDSSFKVQLGGVVANQSR